MILMSLLQLKIFCDFARPRAFPTGHMEAMLLQEQGISMRKMNSVWKADRWVGCAGEWPVWPLTVGGAAR